MSARARPCTASGDGPDPRAEALDRLGALVEARSGIAVTGTSAGRRLEAAVAAADAAAILERTARLAASLDVSPEWQCLLDQLLVPETYLFRDDGQLELMRETGLVPVAGRSGADRAMRLWSAGCCTGEEAYSMAVLALRTLAACGSARETEAAIEPEPGWQIEVLGTDISARSVGQAQLGVYRTGELSPFRAMPERHLRYFPCSGPMQRRVRADIRRHARFERAGLLQASPGPARFDVVACRNVLVYLTDTARQQVLETVAEAVRPGGLLLLGPTDPPPDPVRFATLWGHGSLAYRRREQPA